MALATEPRLAAPRRAGRGPRGRRAGRLRELLDALPRTLPVLLIEHDMSLALGLADRVLCLHNGRSRIRDARRGARDERVQAVYLGRAVARA